MDESQKEMGGCPMGLAKNLYRELCRIFPLDTDGRGKMPVYHPWVIHNRGVDNCVENVDKP